MLRGLAVVVCVVSALALAACGGGTEETAPAPAEPAETAAPAEAPAPEAPSEPSPPPAEPPLPPEEPPPPPEEPPSPPPEEPPPPEPKPEPLPGLPEFTAGYSDWLRLNETPIPPIEGGDPHLGTKNVYASREAKRSGGELLYPNGTVIVKEANRPDTDFIGLIATMRKKKGADPAHNDWVFIEYARSSPDEPFSELARDSVCWGCHSGAAATDYVWVHTTGAAP